MDKVKRALFIGRWQPLHKGHVALIRKAIEAGNRPVIAIRATPVSASEPFGIEQRRKMIRAEFGSSADVIVIPDIASVNVGRQPGYTIKRWKLNGDLQLVSGTKIRECLREGWPGWKEMVTPAVARCIEPLADALRRDTDMKRICWVRAGMWIVDGIALKRAPGDEDFMQPLTAKGLERRGYIKLVKGPVDDRKVAEVVGEEVNAKAGV